VGLHHDSRQPRSLRVRLLLWYGTLLAVALGSFVVLILFLATDAIGQSVDSAIRAEARIALLDMSRELSPTPPYWPIQLSLPVIDTYRDPGIVEELLLLARADAHVDTPSEAHKLDPTGEQGTRKGSIVELDHAVLQLVRQLRRRLNIEGSILKLEIGHIEPVRVRGDEESLRRVTLILLDNALKYTPSTGGGGGARHRLLRASRRTSGAPCA
jgi:hypothetical protein